MVTDKIKENKCEFCGYKYDKDKIKIGEQLDDIDPCYCSIINLIYKLKKKVKGLKEENKMLNKFLDIADPYSWDVKLQYEDILYGKFNGNDIEGIKPDKKFAKWFANRFNVEEEED